MEELLPSLRKDLDQSSVILIKQDEGFKDALKRWSDYNNQIPLAIVQPSSEADIVKLIRELAKTGVPYVPACGGHSTYSTVKDGFIIDLRRYKDIVVDSSRNTVTVKGGILMKELQLALAKENLITTVANGNTVGVIPYFIGGGINSYAPMVGFACENIISAKMITAAGQVVEASSDQNSDLLWAIRGAGQHFGLVIELVIRTYPKTLISEDGSRQMGTYIFGIDKAEAVCKAISEIIMDAKHVSVGHFMIMTMPKAPSQQILLIAPQYFGLAEKMAEVFRPLLDLEPMMQMQNTSTFETHSDHLAYLCDKGDFKRFSQTGLQSFSPEHFVKLVDIHRQLLTTYPDTERSCFTFEWHTPTKNEEAEKVDTSFGNKGVDFWLNVILWYTNPSLHEQMGEYDQAARKQMRHDTVESAYISYTNSNREDPVEYRYKGDDRLSKLRDLKKIWDPKGGFTKEFL
ncbi:hypothetical protein MMC25_005467 [Agyrium rufum]|nr:hypothetical protein [Agyrium rufum]